MASPPYLNMIVLLSSSLCIYLIFKLAKVLNKIWWNPIRIRKFMASQGIEGHSYRFGYGSTEEILAMRKEALVKPMTTLSHDKFPKVRPDTCTWIKTYGNQLTNHLLNVIFIVDSKQLNTWLKLRCLIQNWEIGTCIRRGFDFCHNTHHSETLSPLLFM